MRILMIHTFHHTRGGDSTYVKTLTEGLQLAGHTVAPFAMRHPENNPSIWEARFLSWRDLRQRPSPVARLRLAKEMIWSKEASQLCAEIIEDFRPDVAHIQHVHRHLTPSVLDPLNAAGIPTIWTLHDYELICPSGHLFTQDKPCTRCRDGNYLHAIQNRCKWDALLPSTLIAAEKFLHRQKKVWERVDRFLCPSQFLANQLVDFGVPSKRIQTIHNPLNLDQHPFEKSQGSGWLYAGRLTWEKGVDVAIEAARMLPEHRLTICGDGPMRDKLEQLAAGLPQVAFVGHLPVEELATRIRQSRVIAVPSRWFENYPYAVLEAQAAGRAVVASAIGGIPEQIDDGRDGILVPPNDPEALARALSPLLAENTHTQQLGHAARSRAEDRHPGPHTQKILKIYREMIDKQP